MTTGSDLDSTLKTAGPGWIMLARHGEPALSRAVLLNAPGYLDWWARYEEGGILEGQTPPAGLVEMARKADVIFASTRRRALETTDAVAPGRLFTSDPIFIEAPLPPPPFPGFIRLNPRTWGFISRFCWWFFGNHGGQEPRRQSELRAREAAKKLIGEAEAGRNVLVLAHGFFNTMVGRELRRAGWRSVEGRGYKYWSTRVFQRG